MLVALNLPLALLPQYPCSDDMNAAAAWVMDNADVYLSGFGSSAGRGGGAGIEEASEPLTDMAVLDCLGTNRRSEGRESPSLGSNGLERFVRLSRMFHGFEGGAPARLPGQGSQASQGGGGAEDTEAHMAESRELGAIGSSEVELEDFVEDPDSRVEAGKPGGVGAGARHGMLLSASPFTGLCDRLDVPTGSLVGLEKISSALVAPGELTRQEVPRPADYVLGLLASTNLESGLPEIKRYPVLTLRRHVQLFGRKVQSPSQACALSVSNFLSLVVMYSRSALLQVLLRWKAATKHRLKAQDLGGPQNVIAVFKVLSAADPDRIMEEVESDVSAGAVASPEKAPEAGSGAAQDMEEGRSAAGDDADSDSGSEDFDVEVNDQFRHTTSSSLNMVPQIRSVLQQLLEREIHPLVKSLKRRLSRSEPSGSAGASTAATSGAVMPASQGSQGSQSTASRFDARRGHFLALQIISQCVDHILTATKVGDDRRGKSGFLVLIVDSAYYLLCGVLH